MEKKGLCSTCVYDISCDFLRKFPVVHCEEFDNVEKKVSQRERRKRAGTGRRRNKGSVMRKREKRS